MPETASDAPMIEGEAPPIVEGNAPAVPIAGTDSVPPPETAPEKPPETAPEKPPEMSPETPPQADAGAKSVEAPSAPETLAAAPGISAPTGEASAADETPPKKKKRRAAKPRVEEAPSFGDSQEPPQIAEPQSFTAQPAAPQAPISQGFGQPTTLAQNTGSQPASPSAGAVQAAAPGATAGAAPGTTEPQAAAPSPAAPKKMYSPKPIAAAPVEETVEAQPPIYLRKEVIGGGVLLGLAGLFSAFRMRRKTFTE